MLQGKNLIELAQEIQRQAAVKRDFIASAETVTLQDDGNTLALAGIGDFTATEVMHDQIGNFLNIPIRYYDRVRASHPALLAENVNTLLHTANAKRMVRTLDGSARAFLSDRYRRFDHGDLAEVALPLILEEQLQVVSCEITERKLYLQVVNQRQEAEVKAGDDTAAGQAVRGLLATHGAAAQLLADCEQVVAATSDHYQPFVWSQYRADRSALFRLIKALAFRSIYN